MAAATTSRRRPRRARPQLAACARAAAAHTRRAAAPRKRAAPRSPAAVAGQIGRDGFHRRPSKPRRGPAAASAAGGGGRRPLRRKGSVATPQKGVEPRQQALHLAHHIRLLVKSLLLNLCCLCLLCECVCVCVCHRVCHCAPCVSLGVVCACVEAVNKHPHAHSVMKGFANNPPHRFECLFKIAQLPLNDLLVATASAPTSTQCNERN